MARCRCGYFGFILGFLIAKCMAQDATTPRKPGGENSTEEMMDNFNNNAEQWNISTQLENNVTERTYFTIGIQTSMASGLNSADSNASNSDVNISPFITLDSTTSNDGAYVTKQENPMNWSVEFRATSSANSYERSSTVEFANNNNGANGFSTDIPELEDLLNGSTSLLPSATNIDSVSTVIDVNENELLINRTISSTNIIKTSTDTDTEISDSHNLISSSDRTDNALSNVTDMIIPSSENVSLSDTVSAVFSSTVEPDLVETGINTVYFNGSNSVVTTKTMSDISDRFETTKLPSPSLNETETTRSFEEDAGRESSANSELDNVKTVSHEFTSEPQVDLENTTNQIIHRETATPSKTAITVDHSSSATSSDSVSTDFNITDIIDSTMSPSSVLSSSTAENATNVLNVPVSYNESESIIDDNEKSTERFPLMTLSININTTNSPDGTIVTSTEIDTSKASMTSNNDIIGVTERENDTTEKSSGSTIFESTDSSTSTLTPNVSSEFITKYVGSNIISTASTLSSHNDSMIDFTSATDKYSTEEKSYTVPPSLEVNSWSAQSTEEFVATTTSSPTASGINDSSTFSFGITQKHSTNTSDNASIASSHGDVSSVFTSTTNTLSPEETTSSIRPSSGLSTLSIESTTSDGFPVTWDIWKMNESTTPSFRTTQKHSTSIADRVSSPSSHDDSASELTSTTVSFSTEDKTSIIRLSSRVHSLSTENIITDSFPTTWTDWKINESSTPSSFSTTESHSTSIPDSTSTSSLHVHPLSGFTSTSSEFEEKTSSIRPSSGIRTEPTIPDIFSTQWTSWKIIEPSASSSFETTQKHSTSISGSGRFSTTMSSIITPTGKVKKVKKCLANATEMESGNTVTVLFSFSSISLQQEVRDDDSYEIRFQRSALACFDSQLHLIQNNNKNDNKYSTISSEDRNQHSHPNFDSKRTIVCASPALSPKGQSFSITFYVREFVNGSEKDISANIIARSLNSCKSAIEVEVGLNITGIFENVQVPPTMTTKEEIHEKSTLQRHATLFISISIVLGLLLIFGTIAFVYFYCCSHSRRYDAEKKKFKQDMSASIEIGDMISGNEILNGEMGEKEFVGLSNGSSAHLIKMEDDGWVAPYSEIPLEEKNPPDVQDTKL